MKVHFVTPTRISLIDITSMGDSSKRGDDKTIGQYDSGLKYAIALLLRHDVNLTIRVQGEPKIHEKWEEETSDVYNFNSYVEKCDNTGKEKELILVECQNIPHGGECMNQFDMREPSGPAEWTVKTGFAKALGYNWSLWMALREIWSNMLDEGGHLVTVYEPETAEGTVMTLEFDVDSEFGEVWTNRHIYINEKEPLFVISESVEALLNPEGYLRIYKQNILVYKDEAVPSRYAYNIRFGEIDERRILSNITSIERQIVEAIQYTDNINFLATIIKKEFPVPDGEFLSRVTVYGSASNEIHDRALECYEMFGEVQSYDWLILSVKRRKDCKIGGKILRSVADHVFAYSNDVKVESTPKVIPGPFEAFTNEEDRPLSFVELVNQSYNFTVECEVRRAKLIGSKVIADKFEKCLIIDESFSIEEDMADFIVQYIDLTQQGNIIKNLSEFICRILKK